MVQTCERETLSEEVREIKNGGFKEVDEAEELLGGDD